MSNETSLIRTAEKTLSVKSLKDLVRVRTSEIKVLLLDVSGSMKASLRNGKTRIEGLREVVAGIQSRQAVPMIAFGIHPHDVLEPTMRGEGEVAMVTEVPDASGSTPLAEAIDMARLKGFGQAVVISDGCPNDQHSAMESARQFGGRIDVIFVGNPGEYGSAFLDELAKITGGSRFEGDLAEVKELTGAVIGLLNGEVLEQSDDDEDDDDEDDEDDDEDEDDEDA